MRPGMLWFLMMIAASPALAVYKCETRQGILYTDAPCGDGQVELPPAPGASDPEAARQRALNDRKQLAVIEKEEARARSERRQYDTGRNKVAASHKKRCTLLGLEKKWSAEDAAAASHLVSDKAEALKRQARRKAERFEAECQEK